MAKYAIALPADQTIVYLMTTGEVTTKHPEAGLWDTKEDAKNALFSFYPQERAYDVDTVEDVKEFRSREDTW